MKIELTKIKESDNPRHPNNIEEGFVISGEMIDAPKVGNAFWVGHGWRTSLVVKVIDDTTFETMNSVYRIKPISSAPTGDETEGTE